MRLALSFLTALALAGLLAPSALAGLAPSATTTESAPSPSLVRLALAPLPKERFFEGAGVVVGQATGFPSTRARLLAEERFRFVALKLHHGLGHDPTNLEALEGGWAESFRRAGVAVCGWGVGETEPEAEARLAAELVRRYELDCYIVDAEAPYMGGDYGGDVSRSRRFADTFSAELPSLPKAVTTMGAAHAPWVYPFDYAAWAEGGYALLPQAYLSIGAHYCPRCTLEHAQRAGFPSKRVHPMIGVGWSQGAPAHSGADYLAPLKEAGARGFTVFLGETTSDDDLRALGDGVAAGLAG